MSAALPQEFHYIVGDFLFFMRLVICFLTILFMQLTGFHTIDASFSKSEERVVMANKNELFDFILKIGEQHAFTPEKLSSLTGIPLLHTDSKPFFSLYFSPENCENHHPYIKKIELRSPYEKENPGGLIIIDFYNTEHITEKDVISRFGQIDDLGVPFPEQPPDSPLYFSYKFDWGELRLGFSPMKPESLISVVLDAYESKAFKEYKIK